MLHHRFDIFFKYLHYHLRCLIFYQFHANDHYIFLYQLEIFASKYTLKASIIFTNICCIILKNIPC